MEKQVLFLKLLKRLIANVYNPFGAIGLFFFFLKGVGMRFCLFLVLICSVGFFSLHASKNNYSPGTPEKFYDSSDEERDLIWVRDLFQESLENNMKKNCDFFDILRKAIKNRVGVNVKHECFNGGTVLHVVVKKYRVYKKRGVEIVKALLAVGADVLIKDKYGKRAFDFIANEGVNAEIYDALEGSTIKALIEEQKRQMEDEF